jgi:hypothetical protein
MEAESLKIATAYRTDEQDTRVVPGVLLA